MMYETFDAIYAVFLDIILGVKKKTHVFYS